MHIQKLAGAGVLMAIFLGLIVVAIAPVFAQSNYYGNGATMGTYCPQLSQTLVRGASGAQVLELQKFLSNYYAIPQATIQTGYFGRITQGYVIQFQKEQGLPSYGIVGSMTRASIAGVCSGSKVSTTGGSSTGGGPGTLSASPSTGLAALTVNFVADVDNVSIADYRVEFGDGQSSALQNNCPGGATNGCGKPSAQHIYTQGGTYSARLVQKSTCAIDTVCWVPVLTSSVTSSSVTISVGSGIWPTPTPAPTSSGSGSVQSSSGTITLGSGPVCEHAAPPAGCYWQSGTTCASDKLVCASASSANFNVTPASGSAPLAVSFNASAGDANPATFFIDFGDGSSASAGVLSTQHTYVSAGTYTAILKRTAAAGGATVWTATITVTNG